MSPLPPPYGGMAVQAEKLSELLEKEGYEVLKIKTNVQLSGYLNVFERIPFIRAGVRSLIFLYRLNSILKKVEIIYFLTSFFNFFFWVTYPALMLVQIRKKQVILSARGGGAQQFFRRYHFFVKPIFKRLHAITVPSGFLKAAFKEEMDMDTILVPNIADLDLFPFVRRKTFKPKIIVTRSLEAIYDVGTAVRAFHVVKNELPDATLGIVGDGSLKQSLINLVAELGLNSSVIFYGEVNHEQIPKIYNQHDLFLNSSRVDNLPGSILEAFASGLPVVSTNAGGIPYMVVHKESGLLSEIGDYDALAANLIKILKNPEYGRALAMKGYLEIQKYTWSNIKSIIMPLIDRS